MFQISHKIKIAKNADMVWELISSPGHLNQFHPFCEENKVLESKNDIILKDQLNYLNGITYYRTFTDWKPMIGYRIKIGSKKGKESDVKWQIIDKGVFTYVKITVRPYTSSKIHKLLYPIFHYAVIRPKLKSYLKSVLRGLEYYLTHKKPVPRNEFGNHSWFT
jgi:ribosome-associated toxin RatA of RatAB toxin-antitoxin module